MLAWIRKILKKYRIFGEIKEGEQFTTTMFGYSYGRYMKNIWGRITLLFGLANIVWGYTNGDERFEKCKITIGFSSLSPIWGVDISCAIFIPNMKIVKTK